MIGGSERVKPQWVRHADGYQVYSDDGDRVAYEDDRGKAVVDVERLVEAVALGPQSIRWEAADGMSAHVVAQDRAPIGY